MYKSWRTLLLAALSLAASAEEVPELALADAWVRALPPTQETTAAYLTLRNRGQGVIEVVGATADVARVIQIHTTREVDGYQRMERLDGLTLAPGESVVLAPGGIHLMLLGLERMPGAGESVRLCLQLADGAEACAEAEVRGATEAVPDQHHHSEGQYHE